MKTKAIVFVAPGKAEFQDRDRDDSLAPDRVLLKTECTPIRRIPFPMPTPSPARNGKN